MSKKLGMTGNERATLQESRGGRFPNNSRKRSGFASKINPERLSITGEERAGWSQD
jgi:hypothetical protein